MNFTELIYFKTVAKQQSFTQAAEQLNVTQSAVSKAISRLELKVGMPLFDRIGKKAILNYAGETLLAAGEKVLDSLDNCQETMNAISSGLSGKIHFGCTVQLEGPMPLNHFAWDFFERHPNIRLRFLIMDFHEIMEQLLAKNIDFGIVAQNVNSPVLESTRLYSDLLGIIVCDSHPLAERRSVSMCELFNERWLLNTSADNSFPLHPDIEKAFCPNIIFEGPSAEFIGRAVAKGYGISFCTRRRFEFNAASEAENPNSLFHNGSLRFVELIDDFAQRSIYLLRPRTKHAAPVTQIFYDEVMAYFKIGKAAETDNAVV